MLCLCDATVTLRGGIGDVKCLLERAHDEHPLPPPITRMFGSSEGGRGGGGGVVIGSAVPGQRHGEHPLFTPPPLLHECLVFQMEGGGQVNCSAVLG